MDFLDRMLSHDGWTTSLFLSRARELSEEELDEPMNMGPGSVRATLAHIVWNTEAWSASMAGESPTRLCEYPSLDEIEALHNTASRRLTRVAAEVRARAGWDERWLDSLDDPPTEKTFGGAIAHVLTHSMHHRAQLLYMLRRLGIQHLPEGDVLSWEQQMRDA